MSNQERGQEALDTLSKALKGRERAEKRRPLAVVAMSAVAILAIVGGIWFLATRDSEEDVVADGASTSAEPTQEAHFEQLSMQRSQPLPETVTCTYDSAGQAAKQVATPEGANVPARGHVGVTLETAQGPIGMTLDRATAPCTTNAIEHLAKEKYFDGTVCHRLTTSGIFVLQCGDPSGKGSGGPGFQFANEYPTDEAAADKQQTPVTYPRGSIAMANAGKDTNGSQFFLNYKDSPLPPQYTYFGQISEDGLKTLDKIAEAGVAGGQTDGKPAEEVRINSARVEG
ncbi:isomerase [Corynebacterium atypicum]|uniref:Isomerase n=1 Tax=Corynebacterium atypicum TaxID=191610 RepID=A0ABM5QMQ5_9CORY|nr:peptidylprolyl isomerase [Corynebacterium atypicum]AIG64055.1 isomerase [Corynebacterium atypicum]